MSTTNIPLTNDWQEVAVGPGYVTMTSHGYSAQFVISDTAPTLKHGHWLPFRENVSLDLEDGDSVYVKGDALVAVTAENEPT